MTETYRRKTRAWRPNWIYNNVILKFIIPLKVINWNLLKFSSVSSTEAQYFQAYDLIPSESLFQEAFKLKINHI